jgi:Tol biopolymer transport system component
VIDIDPEGAERLLVAPDDLPGEGEGEARVDRLPYDVSWLPGGDRVAFNTLLTIEHGLVTNDDLWIVDVESGELTRLLEDGEGGAFAFSPDGDALVVADASTVSILDADGTNRRTLLTFETVNTASEYAYIPQPVWTPDGAYALVAISSPEPFTTEGEPGATLWRLPRDANRAQELNELEGEFLRASMTDELWSPDREHMAYLAGEDQVFTTLMIADAYGSDPEPYATGVTDLHGWSPDGATVAYAVGGERAREVATYRLLLGAPGADPIDVTPTHTAAEVLDLQWIDADTFVYITGETGQVVLNIGQVEGADRPLVTGVSAFDTVD